MRLARFTHAASKKEAYGLLRGKNIIHLPELSNFFGKAIPPHLEKFVSLGFKEKNIRELIQKATRTDLETATYPLDETRLLAPIVSPSKIICLGLNYKDHAHEQGQISPQEPIIFMKPRTTIIGPEERIIKPDLVTQLDYEAELAIVVGKRCKNTTVKEAKRYILGTQL
jgi:2-keto-4-pentenoate hydratase/2-oxohepta-3-ene-1,7-dioic acid hydratase in catechol pathway